MMMRKPARTQGNHKRFSPEAYGEFPLVEAERIAALRERMSKEMAGEEWEVLEDVVEH